LSPKKIKSIEQKLAESAENCVTSPSMLRPALLVSVRSLDEAESAVAGGCDILDVKEPLRGPLGMADVRVMGRIAEYALSQPSRSMPCSAAMGEILDWTDATERLALPPGVTHAKLGPAGLSTRRLWLAGWRTAVERLTITANGLRLVAVGYADWNSAQALPPRAILPAAIEAGCDAFLIDTYVKDGRSLLDSISVRELAVISEEARNAGVPLALAGSLRMEHILALVAIRPNVIAVRSAACRGGRRQSKVSARAVRALKAALVEVFRSAAPAADAPALADALG
jgi:(5-formylfuran-3-yl)methyl phosphate synthase